MGIASKVAARAKRALIARLPLQAIQARLAKRRGILFFDYHSLAPDLDDYAYRTSAQAFETHLDFLQENFDIVSSSEAVALLRAGEVLDRSRPLACICFDDGYRDNLTLATPILERFGVPATLFASRDLVQRDGSTHMNEAELRTLADHPGWTVGAHGLTHCVLTSYRREERLAELRDSAAWLSDLLGQKPLGFAYPQGDLSRDVVEQARDQYDHAFSTDRRTKPGFDAFQIRRYCPTQADDALEVFARALLGAPMEDGIA